MSPLLRPTLRLEVMRPVIHSTAAAADEDDDNDDDDDDDTRSATQIQAWNLAWKMALPSPSWQLARMVSE